MKILIFSDSHGSTFGMKKILARITDADVLIHLGDGSEEFALIAKSHPQMPSYSVAGNMEEWRSFGKKTTAEQIITLDGIDILLTHGHRFGVKDSLDRYHNYAHARGVRYALFGHTHLPTERYFPDTGITLFNPGSISFPREGKPSFGTMEIRGDAVLFGHGTL